MLDNHTRQVLTVPLHSYTLSNGMQVVLHRDDSLPIVAVSLWYHVGSMNDPLGNSGLAHLVEHLMFEGSAGYDGEYFVPLQSAGASVNGSTSRDRTNYYEVLPSQFLERALFLESDRLARLTPVLTDEKLENQRAVVMNERRQRIDNRPYGRLSELLVQQLYPTRHPYSWPVIGWWEDLRRITREDVVAFLADYYQPANATLTLAGNFAPAEAERLVERYFGVLQPTSTEGTFISWPAKTVRLPADKCLRHEDRVGLPRLDLCWATVRRDHPDEAALDYVAEILAGSSEESRLYRRLVRHDHLATAVGASHGCLKLAGEFYIRAYGLDHRPLDPVRAVIDEEVFRLAESGPTPAEMERVRRLLVREALGRVETVLGRASTFADTMLYRGDVGPEVFIEEVDRYVRVTPADVQRVAAAYLSHPRVIIETVADSGEAPAQSGMGAGSAPGGGPPGKKTRNGPPADTHLPKPTAPLPFRMIHVERVPIRPGLDVLHVHWPRLPRIDLEWLADGGTQWDTPELLGLGRLATALLDQGSAERTSSELTIALDRLGSTLSASCETESASLRIRTLRETWEESSRLFAEVLQAPRYAADDFAREQRRQLANLSYQEHQPSYQAELLLDALSFGGDHPYGRRSQGTPETVGRLTAELCAEHYQRYFRPRPATLVAVGDVTLEEVIALAQRLPVGGADPQPAAIHPPAAAPPGLYGMERPNAAQTMLRMALPAIPRVHPDYFPLLLFNIVFGGQFASRLNLRIREEKGLTYGARSSLVTFRSAGTWEISADVDSDHAAEAVNDILGELDAIGRDLNITPEELGTARDYVRLRFPARFETASSILSHLTHLATYRLPTTYYHTYLDALAAVTLDDVHRVVRTYLHPAWLRVVAVAPAATIESIARVVPRAPEVPTTRP